MKKTDSVLALSDSILKSLGIDEEKYKITGISEDCFDLILDVASKAEECTCPHCGEKSRKVKMTYTRTVEHKPIGKKRGYLRIKVRCFKCENPDCSHKSFSEPIDFVDRYQRRTKELNDKLLNEVTNLGFSGTCRLNEDNYIDVSVSSLRRLLGRDL